MKNKISPFLIGGLGNLLFQVSSAYAYALDNNYDFICYDSLYNPHHHNINDYKNTFFSKIKFINSHESYDFLNSTVLISEKTFRYDSIPKIKKDILLRGCFQSPKYFEKYESEIRNLYNFNSSIYNKYKEALNKKTCSVHVRRGDYLIGPQINTHIVQDFSYYQKSIEIMAPDTLFLVFSDDIEWCKLNFNKKNTGIDNYLFIERQSSEEDLILMSLCANNIICNSTFSWWAAWLNKNLDKKVIAPREWFNKRHLHEICLGNVDGFLTDLIPEKWITL